MQHGVGEGLPEYLDQRARRRVPKRVAGDEGVAPLRGRLRRSVRLLQSRSQRPRVGLEQVATSGSAHEDVRYAHALGLRIGVAMVTKVLLECAVEGDALGLFLAARRFGEQSHLGHERVSHHDVVARESEREPPAVGRSVVSCGITVEKAHLLDDAPLDRAVATIESEEERFTVEHLLLCFTVDQRGELARCRVGLHGALIVVADLCDARCRDHDRKALSWHRRSGETRACGKEQPSQQEKMQGRSAGARDDAAEDSPEALLLGLQFPP